LDGTNLPSATINLNSNKITNLGNPTNNTDLVNKEYVDTDKVVKTGDIMTGDLIVKTGTGPIRNLGCDDISLGVKSFNLLLGSNLNKITYNTSVGPIYMNAVDGVTVNQNGTAIMKISKGPTDPRIDVFQDVLLNQKFLRDVKDPILDKDAVTKIYSDSIRYVTATPNMTSATTVIDELLYTASASSSLLASQPWQAFGNTFNPAGWITSNAPAQHITLQYPYPISMRGLSMIAVIQANITSCTIQYSNDGITFTDAMPTITSLINSLVLYTFNFPAATALYWRLRVNSASFGTYGFGLLKWIPEKSDLYEKRYTTGYIPRLDTNLNIRGFESLASSENSASYRACNAFRQNYVATPGVDGEWATNGVTSNFWLQIKCPMPVKIWKVGLTGRAGSVSANRITNWRIQASNNGTDYITIYTAPNPTPLGVTYQEFNIDSIGEFTFYRIFAVNAEATSPGLSVFQLFVYV
jgi:hypothetical protein